MIQPTNGTKNYSLLLENYPIKGNSDTCHDKNQGTTEDQFTHLIDYINSLKPQLKLVSSNSQQLESELKDLLESITNQQIAMINDKYNQKLLLEFRDFSQQVFSEAKERINKEPMRQEYLIAEATQVASKQKNLILEVLEQSTINSDEIGLKEYRDIATSKPGNASNNNYNNYLNLPFAIMSLLILKDSIDVMAQQSQMALKKIQDLQAVLEEIQALNSFMVALQNKLNTAYGHKVTKDDGTKDNNNNMTWQDAQQYYGNPVDHDIYDFSLPGGTFPEDFFNQALMLDPLLKFLVDNKLVEVKTKIDHGKTFYTIPKKVKIDISALSDSQKAEFKSALSLHDKNEKEKNNCVKYKHSEFTTDPTFYDKDGNQVTGGYKKHEGGDPWDYDGMISNPKYKGSVIFAKSEIPSFLLPYIQDYGLCTSSDKDSPIEYYAINQEALDKLSSIVVSKYDNVLGSRKDFTSDGLKNDLLTGSVSTLQVRMDTLNNLIKFVQETISSETKIPDQAKTDADYKLQQFLDSLPRTQYNPGN